MNGSYVTLNNRTLYVARQAGLSNVTPTITGASGYNQAQKLLRNSGMIMASDTITVRCP